MVIADIAFIVYIESIRGIVKTNGIIRLPNLYDILLILE